MIDRIGASKRRKQEGAKWRRAQEYIISYRMRPQSASCLIWGSVPITSITRRKTKDHQWKVHLSADEETIRAPRCRSSQKGNNEGGEKAIGHAAGRREPVTLTFSAKSDR